MRLRNSKRALASASTSTTINPKSELEVEVTGESEAPTPTPTPLEKPNETLTQPTVKSNPTSGSEAVNHVQKKRKTTSNIWTHFKPIGEGEQKRANCRHCQINMSAKSSCGTMHLWRHLERCGPFKTSSQQTLIQSSATNTSDTLWMFSQKASRELLTKLIIADERPFTSVEHPIFKQLIASLQPKFKLHGRTTLKKDVMDMHQEMKSTVSREIAEANRISLTTDLWTSSNQTPFMVISAHFISADWTLNKRIISFKMLPPPHTGLAIADQLLASIMEWKILDKVMSITVDNASSNDVAIARVLSILRDKSHLPPHLDGKFFHVRCAAHIINLVVKDGLKTLSPAITKIQNSVRHIKASPSRKHQFKEMIKSNNIKQQALPSVDVPTRWNSTYLMLKSALPYRDAFNSLSIHDSSYHDLPTYDEWEEIILMKDFLSLFNTATLKLGMTRHPSAHMLYSNMTSIDKLLKESLKSSALNIPGIVEPMQEKFNKYWKNMETFAGINLVFDPQYKLAMVEFLLADELGSSKSAITGRVNKIKEDIKMWFKDVAKGKQDKKSTSTNATTSIPQSKPLESDQDAQFKEFLAGKTMSSATSATAEIDLYLQEPTVPLDTQGFNILKWWSVNSLRFPTLSILARNTLTIPMTSIASESAFSTGGRVLSDSRNRLKPVTLEALICTQDWINTNDGLDQISTGELAEDEDSE
ncbi:hypothetical protein PCANC_22752 [Puccinia coronata f. sp. avenae]|uniref:BED-type domain-containing protein n=1 Tax=Puccinia coronata f. sp. avenae TaxID=200324 RepID=A0A2N5U2B6_9BASI|nr:hypothetical protein PCANC_22752 [Puccinia coronata f. sp. avenae]